MIKPRRPPPPLLSIGFPVFAVFAVFAALALAGAGCGGSHAAPSDGGSTGTGGSAPTDGHVSNVVVSVSPATANLDPGGTQAFTATVTGDSNTAVTWTASGGSISAAGVFTAPAGGGAYVIRATSAADPLSSGTAIVNVSGPAASVIEPFYSDEVGPYVQIMTPMPSATYFAPATIRIWAHATDYDSDGVNNYSPQVDFYLGTMMVGSVRPTDIDYYEVDVTGVPAGSYEISAKSVMAKGTVESLHIPITVIDVPPHAGPTMTLTSDLVLSGGTNLEILGTEAARALVTSSNGSRIRSASGWTGHLTIQNADIIGLGSMDVPSIEVNTTGPSGIEISGSVFDRCGPPSLTADGQGAVNISNNTFQPNILTPVNGMADYAGSHPSLTIAGDSSASKLFQGNNIGVSFVRFDRSSHWLIGGDTDALGNIAIGVRAGFEIDGASDITVRGNISYHRYPFGWSQGMNLNFDGMGGPALVEHNMFRGSSWMVQTFKGELRYNLMVDCINHSFFRDALTGASIHHNVLVNVGYQRFYEPSGGIETSSGAFFNNTVDAGGNKLGWYNASFVVGPGTLTSVRNNVFTGFAYQNRTNLVDSGTVTSADYNCFYNPDTTLLTPYGDSGLGAHDCGGAAGANPRFAQARVVPFPIGDGDIWLRKVTISQILALYRGIYTPATGSPLIDAGSPGDDSGGTRNTDIGAVGAGNAHPADLFGRFGP